MNLPARLAELHVDVEIINLAVKAREAKPQPACRFSWIQTLRPYTPEVTPLKMTHGRP